MTGIAFVRAVRAAHLATYGGKLVGVEPGAILERVVRPSDAEKASDLVVLTSPRWLESARRAAGIVLTTPSLAERLERGSCWLHELVPYALACLLDDFASIRNTKEDRFRAGAPPGAALSVDATLCADVTVEPGVVVFGGASIGPSAHLGAHSVIYGNVTLGSRVRVGAGAVIGSPGFGWATGPDGKVRRVPQLGGVEIGDDVEIGALSTIDAGTLGPTRIGSGVKLDAQVHVGHNAELGEDVMVAAQSGFGGSVEIAEGVLVGGQVGVADHVRVGSRARLAARSGVIGDIPPGAVVAGYPAVSKSEWLRAFARLRRGARGAKPR